MKHISGDLFSLLRNLDDKLFEYETLYVIISEYHCLNVKLNIMVVENLSMKLQEIVYISNDIRYKALITPLSMLYRGYISPRFSSNSEAYASELLENIEDIL